MINFRAEIVSDGLVEQFGKRPFNRAVKPVLKGMLLFWHRNYVKRHFGSEGPPVQFYPEYAGPYGQSDEPMVDTGSLRTHVTKRKGLRDVTGTSRSATLKMGFGAPYRRKYQPAAMRRRAFSLMRRNPGLTFKQALNKLYSKVGYDAKSKAMFQLLITAINDQEMAAIVEVGRKRLIRELNANKRRTKKRIR